MQARTLPAARGIAWVTGGFLLYRRGPALLSMLTMFYLLVAVGSSLLAPVGPFLLSLLLPTLTVLVSNGCRILDRPPGTPLVHTELLQCVTAQRGPLLRLGGLQLVSTLLVLGVDLLIDASDWSALVLDEEALQPLHMLRLTLLAFPMFMAFWFAPLLTAWDGVPAAKSLFFSLVASLRNWRAFLAYGAVVVAIGVVLPGLLLFAAAAISAEALTLLSAAMPMLLLLIFAPVLMASVYLSYRDVFVTSVSVDA